eukprot:GHVL01023296.1.p1 GENE.GHVL01023296.1~~GHVL01023296.1.p1  ORF type:complete len:168 (-),score=26.97 GHVL01023296.1:29-532(-)
MVKKRRAPKEEIDWTAASWVQCIPSAPFHYLTSFIDGKIWLRDIRIDGGEPLISYKGHSVIGRAAHEGGQGGLYRQPVMDSSGKYIAAVGAKDSAVRIWSVANGALVAKLNDCFKGESLPHWCICNWGGSPEGATDNGSYRDTQQGFLIINSNCTSATILEVISIKT